MVQKPPGLPWKSKSPLPRTEKENRRALHKRITASAPSLPPAPLEKSDEEYFMRYARDALKSFVPDGTGVSREFKANFDDPTNSTQKLYRKLIEMAGGTGDGVVLKRETDDKRKQGLVEYTLSFSPERYMELTAKLGIDCQSRLPGEPGQYVARWAAIKEQHWPKKSRSASPSI